ncbi:histidine triad nucleotide binding protein [Gordonia phage Pupper]|uniref:Histidine triad nucleotide binding protein n=1 Tax=Gordonia phage Pupper TaxID=2571249 RepID=A0A4Y6EIJ9_9CAUD|nr:histidine triad nucleotide binding protein [Gordonia phage Pupper]QDF18566.1 histidine triad nucleotide binding protein [Gordonia phage Pupper]
MPRNCPFCELNWYKLRIVHSVPGDRDNYLIIHPLNPVTEGHLLVIPAHHWKSAGDNPWVAGEAVTVAANYIEDREMEANIITSIGEAATQSVFHLHIHIVPRHEGDGLHLPWTNQPRGDHHSV